MERLRLLSVTLSLVLMLTGCDDTVTDLDATVRSDAGRDSDLTPDGDSADAADDTSTDVTSDTSVPLDVAPTDSMVDADGCVDGCVAVVDFSARATGTSMQARVMLSQNAPCAVEYRLLGQTDWQMHRPTEDSSDYGMSVAHIQNIEGLEAGEYEVRARDHIAGSYITDIERVVIEGGMPSACGAGSTRWDLPSNVNYGSWSRTNQENLFPGFSRIWGDANGNVRTQVLDGRDAQIHRLIPTPPGSSGSSRYAGAWRVPSQRSYRIIQSIRLNDDFAAGVEAQSGKLGFGMGGGSAPTGGQPRDDGFTVRLGFRGDRIQPDTRSAVTPILYVYSADQVGTYGDIFEMMIGGAKVELERGEWTEIEFEIVMNSRASARDGELRAWVNGQLAYEETGKRWFSAGTPSIDQVIVSSFHGGADSRWAPSHTNEVGFSNLCVGQ